MKRVQMRHKRHHGFWLAVPLAIATLALSGCAVGPKYHVPNAPAPPAYPTLKRGSRGDVVVWAQEHLISSGQTVSPDGVYTSTMEQAVRAFQTARALPATGQMDTPTWVALLQYQPVMPDWTKGARASAVTEGPNGPRSAHLGERDEFRGKRAQAASE